MVTRNDKINYILFCFLFRHAKNIVRFPCHPPNQPVKLVAFTRKFVGILSPAPHGAHNDAYRAVAVPREDVRKMEKNWPKKIRT